MRVSSRPTGRMRLVAAVSTAALSGAGLCLFSAAPAVADDPIHSRVDCGDEVMPIDEDATEATVNLFQNMYYSAGDFMMYAHQQDQAANSVNSLGNQDPSHDYGVSAVHEAVGVYPGVFGWDIGHIELKNDNDDWGSAAGDGRPAAYTNSNVDAGAGSGSAKYVYTGATIDGIPVSDVAEWIIEGASWDGVNTISIHSVNPVTYGVYDNNLYKPGRWPSHSTGTATSMVLPGGELNSRYDSWLDAYIDFNELLKDANGEYVPIILRPYHEHSGDWFWWGIDDMERGWRPAEIAEFTELWKYTVDYFRDNGVHNFLYAISPDRSRLGEPSVLYQDLKDNPTKKDVVDKYIDGKVGTPWCFEWNGQQFCFNMGGWDAATMAKAHADVQAAYDLAQTLDASSPQWDEPVIINFQGIPLDIDPVTGAVSETVSTEFDAWFVRDPVTGTSRFEDQLWRKWSEGFPGADYVDLYGLDNYWENGTGHQYHPYTGQTAKLEQMFVASLNIIAKHAREDGKLVALTEGSFSGAELISRVVQGGRDSFGNKYPYTKYTSYALTWWGPVYDATLSEAVDHAKFRWVSDAAQQPIDNAVPQWYAAAPACYTQDGDIDVELEIPQIAGGLGVEFSATSVTLYDAALSADRAWIVGSGDLPAVKVEDTRPGASVGWDATITAGQYLTGPQQVDGKALGIAPAVLSTAEGQVVTAGAPVAAGVGFVAGTEFGSSPAGSSRGVASLGGELSYKIPSSVTPGSYKGVVSVTVL
ncbi:MAG: glycoside hydrolase family 26 protein [Bifidobacteriaceae bacterium]|nr:glycoside hydrolase family 26 protein [Bifidobacteriaceae bacterium]